MSRDESPTNEGRSAPDELLRSPFDDGPTASFSLEDLEQAPEDDRPAGQPTDDSGDSGRSSSDRSLRAAMLDKLASAALPPDGQQPEQRPDAETLSVQRVGADEPERDVAPETETTSGHDREVTSVGGSAPGPEPVAPDPELVPDPDDGEPGPAPSMFDRAFTQGSANNDTDVEPAAPAENRDGGEPQQEGPYEKTEDFRAAGPPEPTAEQIWNTRPPTTVKKPRAAGKVVFVLSGQGAPGRTTTTIALANRAATVTPRVAVVDMHRERGDIAKVLRVGARFPTIADTAITGIPEKGMSRRSDVNEARKGLSPAGFASVFAPPAGQRGPDHVSADVYRRMIDHARKTADLVVVDTPVAEDYDTSGLVDHVVVPMLAGAGAWGLFLADQSTSGFSNLTAAVNRLVAEGADRNRIVAGFNRVNDKAVSVDHEQIERVVAPYATFVGVAALDADVGAALDVGAPPPPGSYLDLLDVVLHRVTGLAAFDTTDRKLRRAAAKKPGKPKQKPKAKQDRLPVARPKKPDSRRSGDGGMVGALDSLFGSKKEGGAYQ